MILSMHFRIFLVFLSGSGCVGFEKGAYFCSCAHVLRITQGIVSWSWHWQSTAPPSTGLINSLNFPTVTKSSSINLYLNQEHLENSSISSSSWTASYYLSKIILKYNYKPFSSPEPTILLACGRNPEALGTLGATISGMHHRCRLRETGWAEFGYFLCYFKMVAPRALDSCCRPEGS